MRGSLRPARGSLRLTQVVFKLHDSFEKPIRVVETAPYELTETGWGEFEIQITVSVVPIWDFLLIH